MPQTHPFDAIREVVDLIDAATLIMGSTATAKMKFDLIFGLPVRDKIAALGMRLEWLDPDTTYEEDAATFHRALVEFKEGLGDLVATATEEDE